MTQHHRRTWSDLTPGRRATVLALGVVQLSLAATAWADLAVRPAEQVAGRKGVWAAVIGVNVLGPVLYLRRGIRR